MPHNHLSWNYGGTAYAFLTEKCSHAEIRREGIQHSLFQIFYDERNFGISAGAISNCVGPKDMKLAYLLIFHIFLLIPGQYLGFLVRHKLGYGKSYVNIVVLFPSLSSSFPSTNPETNTTLPLDDPRRGNTRTFKIFTSLRFPYFFPPFFFL